MNQSRPDNTVLFLARTFPPQMTAGSFRPLRFARDLPDMGWNCVVITAEAECCPDPNMDLMKEIPSDTDVVRFPCGCPPEHLSKWLIQSQGRSGRLKRMAVKALRATFRDLSCPDAHAWSLGGLFKVVRNVVRRRRIDAIVITGPPFSWFRIAAKLKKAFGLPIVLDFRDPWTANSLRYKGTLFWRYWPSQWMERKAVTAADLVILNTPYSKKYFSTKYPQLGDDHWDVVNNGFVLDHMATVEPEPFPRKTLVYGGVTDLWMIRSLVEAMGRLKDRGVVSAESFRFVSFGNAPPDVMQAAEQAGVADMIEFRGRCSHDDVLSALKGASGLLLLLNDILHVPCKLYEYLAAGPPTLMIGPADSDAADILRETGAGVVSALNDVEGIERDLTRLLAGELVGRRDEQAVMRYESKALSGKLAAILGRLTT